ncbi:hypothetical protein CHS0354_024861 [Potamilus streckersoni]|uniref:Uncharacterized protein n=1 Tax=Potamilus streckersoni TaxID=2493646 RepID=A0AAE0SR44_9BIVA|nr:hypothetical protein CHS0354_024861 [Potamilus streckersoni]
MQHFHHFFRTPDILYHQPVSFTRCLDSVRRNTMKLRGIQTFLKAAVVFIFFLLFMKGFDLCKNKNEHLLLERDKRQADNTTPPPPPWDPSLILGEASDLRPVNFNDTQSRGTTQLPSNSGFTEITGDQSLPRSGESSSGRGSVSSETLLNQLLRSIGIGVAIGPKQPRPVQRITQSPRTSPRPQHPVGPKILEFDPLARLLDQGKSSTQSTVNGTDKSGNSTISRDSFANESKSINVTILQTSSKGELRINENGTTEVLINDVTGQTTKREPEESTSEITSTKSTTTSEKEKWTTAYHNSTQDVDVQASTTRHAQSSEGFTSFSRALFNSVFETTSDPSLDQITRHFSLGFHTPSTSTVHNNEINSSSFAAVIAADKYKSSTLQTTNESQEPASSTKKTDVWLNEPNLKITTLSSIIQFTIETPVKKLTDTRQIENAAADVLQSFKPVITKFKGTPSELQGINFAHFKLPMLEKINGINNMVKGGLNRNHLNGPVK